MYMYCATSAPESRLTLFRCLCFFATRSRPPLSLSLSLSRPPPQGKRPATWTRPQTALFEVIRDAPAGDGATDWGTVRRGSVQTDWSSLRAQLSGGKAAGAQAAGDNWTSARDSVSGRLFFTATDGRCSWTVPAKLEFRVDGDGLACVNACDLFLFSFFLSLSLTHSFFPCPHPPSSSLQLLEITVHRALWRRGGVDHGAPHHDGR